MVSRFSRRESEDYSSFVAIMYKKNKNGLASIGGYGMEVNLEQYDTPRDSIELSHNDMPFFKLALVDKHLDETGA